MSTTQRTTTIRLTPVVALALTIAATLAVAACATASAPQLAGKEYVATKVTDGGQDRPLVPGTKLRLNFSASDIGASAGCNHMGGTYRIDGGRLLVAHLGTTDMGCDPDLMEQDQWLSELLGAGPQIRLVLDELVLEAGAISVTFVDREIAEPDAKLVGPTWTVESIITGDAVASVPAEPVATLVFKDDGTLEVNAGCNRGSGTWTTVSGGIEVGPLMLTKMACEKDGADLESAVLGVLEAGTIGAQIDSSLMTLTAGNRGLMLRAS